MSLTLQNGLRTLTVSCPAFSGCSSSLCLPFPLLGVLGEEVPSSFGVSPLRFCPTDINPCPIHLHESDSHSQWCPLPSQMLHHRQCSVRSYHQLPPLQECSIAYLPSQTLESLQGTVISVSEELHRYCMSLTSSSPSDEGAKTSLGERSL